MELLSPWSRKGATHVEYLHELGHVVTFSGVGLYINVNYLRYIPSFVQLSKSPAKTKEKNESLTLSGCFRHKV